MDQANQILHRESTSSHLDYFIGGLPPTRFMRASDHHGSRVRCSDAAYVLLGSSS